MSQSMRVKDTFEQPIRYVAYSERAVVVRVMEEFLRVHNFNIAKMTDRLTHLTARCSFASGLVVRNMYSFDAWGNGREYDVTVYILRVDSSIFPGEKSGVEYVEEVAVIASCKKTCIKPFNDLKFNQGTTAAWDPRIEAMVQERLCESKKTPYYIMYIHGDELMYDDILSEAEKLRGRLTNDSPTGSVSLIQERRKGSMTYYLVLNLDQARMNSRQVLVDRWCYHSLAEFLAVQDLAKACSDRLTANMALEGMSARVREAFPADGK